MTFLLICFITNGSMWYRERWRLRQCSSDWAKATLKWILKVRSPDVRWCHLYLLCSVRLLGAIQLWDLWHVQEWLDQSWRLRYSKIHSQVGRRRCGFGWSVRIFWCPPLAMVRIDMIWCPLWECRPTDMRSLDISSMLIDKRLCINVIDVWYEVIKHVHCHM